MLIRRTKVVKTPLTHAGFTKPVFKGYTDAKGFKTLDAPPRWPFGRKVFVMSKAQPKVPRKPKVDEDEFGL